MYTCSVCGKAFERGATIDGQVVLCPDCNLERETILAEIEYELMKAASKNPDAVFEVLDKLMEERKEKLAKFKTPPQVLKVRMLRRMMSPPLPSRGVYPG